MANILAYILFSVKRSLPARLESQSGPPIPQSKLLTFRYKGLTLYMCRPPALIDTEVDMLPRAILIVLVGLLAIASPACGQASTPRPKTRSTLVYATVTAWAKAAATDKARATSAAATDMAPVTATARAISAATAIATAAPKITARVGTATARAARANPTGTARAISAGATATRAANAGILVSAPAEAKWYWDGERRKWMWEVKFKQVAGRTVTVTKRNTDVYPVDGGHYIDPDGSRLNIEIAAYGSGKDDYWIRADAASTFHDATCVLTYQVVDENGSEISLQVVTKLKDEEK